MKIMENIEFWAGTEDNSIEFLKNIIVMMKIMENIEFWAGTEGNSIEFLKNIIVMMKIMENIEFWAGNEAILLNFWRTASLWWKSCQERVRVLAQGAPRLSPRENKRMRINKPFPWHNPY